MLRSVKKRQFLTFDSGSAVYEDGRKTQLKDQRRKRKFREAKTQKEAEFKMANIASLSFMNTCNTV